MKPTITKMIWNMTDPTNNIKNRIIPWDTQSKVKVEDSLRAFIQGQIDQWNPEKIIVVERKGTAILRAVKELPFDEVIWDWNNAISSNSLNQSTFCKLEGKRILVFDDMMRTGWHISQLLEQLMKNKIYPIHRDNIRVAIFAVHEKAPTRISIDGLGDIDYHWFYRDLTASSYSMLRSKMVSMLQRSGSLLLDTEHLELRVNTKGNLTRFFRSLNRRSHTALFDSVDDRQNITVFFSDIPANEIVKNNSTSFPSGTIFDRIVKKCRVVSRRPSEFAIIPICYPAIPEGSAGSFTNPDNFDFTDFKQFNDDKTLFHYCGLNAALSVLGFLLKDIYASELVEERDFTISLPSAPNSNGKYNLKHLKVVYPYIDIDSLNSRITQIYMKSKAEGHDVRGRKLLDDPDIEIFTRQELQSDAEKLLQLIRYVLDFRLADLESRGYDPHKHPFGLRAREIFYLGREMGWNEIKISVLFDVLIDDAAVVTHVQKVYDPEKKSFYWTRTFEPDGELVSDYIRNVTRQRGLPHILW